MRQIAFVDRDGTIIAEPDDEQVDRIAKLRFLPGAIRGLRALQHEMGYTLVMVSNQDGMGTPAFPAEAFAVPHAVMMQVLESEGITFADVLVDTSFPYELRDTRKPGLGLVRSWLAEIDRERSVVVGDRATDVQFAQAMGIRSVLLRDASSKPMAVEIPADIEATSWDGIIAGLLMPERRCAIVRTTKETSVSGWIDLDGSGRCTVRTGIGFFDHMLEQVVVHAGFDADIVTRGDLHIDEHHTVEDTALAMGDAIRCALADKRGIDRYGFVLPMDEARTLMAIDLCNRPYLRWSVPLKRETIGGLPTELVEHFFRSLADGLRCTLHVEASGSNDHHIVESMFKALGRTLRQAVLRSGETLPTSKGVL